MCETKDGEVVIKAQKVILCTGGFAGNDEMVEKYYPGFKRELVGQGGGMRHLGDGIRMALEAGVRKWKATLPWKRQHRRLRDMMR